MTKWRVGLTSPAERDLVTILNYTVETYGQRQGRLYRAALKRALRALEAGPKIRGSASREELGAGLRSLHMARTGSRGRHLIIYRSIPDLTIEVLRILHDAMDLGQHVTPYGDDQP